MKKKKKNDLKRMDKKYNSSHFLPLLKDNGSFYECSIFLKLDKPIAAIFCKNINYVVVSDPMLQTVIK